MNQKQVLVTGGAGFIGKHTVRKLINKGYTPIVVDRKEKPSDLDCKYYRMDVSKPELEDVYKENNIKYVIHLAALPSVSASIQDPMADCNDNYSATVNVCDLAKKYGVTKMIFSSTAAVYANPKYLPVDEEHPTDFLSPYAITKNASENFIKYCGIDYIIFRYANVYGPGQDTQGEAGVVAKFFDLMNHNLPVEIHGDGEQYRDFVYVDDVAEVNTLALNDGVMNTVINVSTNLRTSVNDLFNILKKELDYKLEPKHTQPRAGDIPKSILNNKKLITLFGYTPSVSVHEGLSIMVNELRKEMINA